MKIKNVASGLVILAAMTMLLPSAARAQCSNYPCGPDGAPLLQRLTPQGFMGADFRGSCAQHDQCYQIPGINRRYCDLQLKQELHRRCECSAFPLGCRMVANTMYMQVRLFGRRPYLNSQYQSPYHSPSPYYAPPPVYPAPAPVAYPAPVVLYGY